MLKLSAFTGLLIATLVFGFTARGQSSAEILHELKKLQNTNRVLYVAAHPDDENTSVISWLQNYRGIRTAYLSLTRGDGGQNLIGTELSAKLGVLRTQELIQARAIDGGEQFFTRAVDFGYSKTADETFNQWNREEVLADVVWAIRKFQPDVIITRFPPDSRGGHGHHTASAILAIEAFDLAADAKAFPEQLQYVDTWQVKRLFWNQSTWWNPKLDSIAEQDHSYAVVDVGQYNDLLGLSCNEISSFSRTQHKSQGFGVSVSRGSRKEYLKLMTGEDFDSDILDGVATGWSRYGWEKGEKALAKIIAEYSFDDPSKSVKPLLELLAMSEQIKNEQEKTHLKTELNSIILQLMGVHVELLSENSFIQSGSEVELNVEVLNRSDLELYLESVKVDGTDAISSKTLLENNEEFSETIKLMVSGEASQPYWLKEPYQNMFKVHKQMLIGTPENEPAVMALLTFSVNGQKVYHHTGAIHKYTDRVEGEIIEPVFITPDVVVNPSRHNLIFVDESAQKLNLKVRAFKPGNYTLHANHEGWVVTPSSIELSFDRPDQEKTISIEIKPSKAKTISGTLNISNSVDIMQSMTEINYNHIDLRLVFEPATVNLVKIDLSKKGERIAYIPGAGDMVVEALEEMGYEVDIMDEHAIRNTDLSQYQAVVAGIRAYNTQDWLPSVKDKLMSYVAAGGNYIVQYNTASRDLLSQDIGPKPFKISRERVTEEDADVEFLIPDHPLLNNPNKITQADFENWVQERGLYFASEWDNAYEAPIGWHDDDEPSRNGGLLITNHGQGAFIYTGISFFRELPAGVPGAYRLLANLISYQNGTADEQ